MSGLLLLPANISGSVATGYGSVAAMSGMKDIGTGPGPAQFGKMAIGGIQAEVGNGYPDIGEIVDQY